jgi:hypothetical protein
MAVKQAGESYRWLFEISDRRNDITAMCQFIQWLKHSGARMVGFNNIGFDYPVIHSILLRPDQATPWSINQTVQRIINTPHDDNRFAHIIWDRDQIVPQMDLYKIHHFDNVARATSLKVLEFNMRSANVQDLPFAPGSYLTSEQIDLLIRYNHHDVDQTEKFYRITADAIRFREELSAKYNRNFLNHNDTKIGKDYFIMRLEEAAPGSCYVTGEGSRKLRQTPRPGGIPLADVVFPYITFQQPEFNRILTWFKSQVITNTKGEFADVSCTIDGFEFVFGTGGIHGSVSSQVVVSDDEYEVVDLDVASYYPNIAIANNLYPQHLGDLFCHIYLDVYQQRRSYPKDAPEYKMLKLALNGVYGDSNNKYSPFFDPQYTMSITVNGQLLICLLAEHLMSIPGLSMVQVNTDGLTVRIPRVQRDAMKRVTDWWQAFTRLELEEAVYSHMWIRDVNNYYGLTTKGKSKRKGAYEHEMQWHQNHSALVIPKAVESCLLTGEPVRDFILNHDDLFDFMLRTKVPRTSRLELDGRQVQNVCRYYVSRSGGPLVKIMPPLPRKPGVERRIGICVGWNVTECNDIGRAVGRDIDFEYYISEAEKLVKPLGI